MKKMIAILAAGFAAITAASVAATKINGVEFVVEEGSYPSCRRGIARVYARDLSSYEWSGYMDAMEWLDPEWDGKEAIEVQWWPSKMVMHPDNPDEPCFGVKIHLANGKTVETVKSCREVYK